MKAELTEVRAENAALAQQLSSRGVRTLSHALWEELISRAAHAEKEAAEAQRQIAEERTASEEAAAKAARLQQQVRSMEESQAREAQEARRRAVADNFMDAVRTSRFPAKRNQIEFSRKGKHSRWHSKFFDVEMAGIKYSSSV